MIARRFFATRRPPIVTIMGHVDHGKTTLLDRLRNANVAAGEPGGITQHLGAFTVKIASEKSYNLVCFLDTPGHAAFKAVRQNGTIVTDLVVLVLAMDDGVMPTTVEAIQLAQRHHLPIIVALNKADLFAGAKAKTDRRKTIASQLSQLHVDLEGEPIHGDTQAVLVSALGGDGLPDLMQAINAQADMLDEALIMVDHSKCGSGYIVEANKLVGVGDTTSVILKNGHLKIGDWMVAGEAFGRVKKIVGQESNSIDTLLPSIPALISGWRSAPQAGEELVVVKNEAEAKELSAFIFSDRKQSLLSRNKAVMAERSSLNASLLQSYRQRLAQATSKRLVTVNDNDGTKNVPQLDVILKADAQGSVEAIKVALQEIPSVKARIEIVTAGQGELSAHDIDMARCCKNPLVVLFNSECPRDLRKPLTHHRIPWLQSNIIYTLIDDVEKRLRALLPKEEAVEVLGVAKIQQLFQVQHGKSPQIVAGCMVTERQLQSGKISREGERHTFRVLRGDAVVFEGPCKSMRHGKEEVSKVPAGMECGLIFEGNPPVLEGDIVQFVRVYQQEPSLV